jgi:type I site-specific restriction-modification system R (restriction) subunit
MRRARAGSRSARGSSTIGFTGTPLFKHDELTKAVKFAFTLSREALDFIGDHQRH